jgi:hypothetical protein
MYRWIECSCLLRSNVGFTVCSSKQYCLILVNRVAESIFNSVTLNSVTPVSRCRITRMNQNVDRAEKWTNAPYANLLGEVLRMSEESTVTLGGYSETTAIQDVSEAGS